MGLLSHTEGGVTSRDRGFSTWTREGSVVSRERKQGLFHKPTDVVDTSGTDHL